MHGNDLRILRSGTGAWDEDVSRLNFNAPMRRDTTLIPAGGYTIIAFYTDNPGIWLVHCHIAWHVSEGLSTTFYVRKQDITINNDAQQSMKQNCQAWGSYWNGGHSYEMVGSGL
jgi:hypothetical protein